MHYRSIRNHRDPHKCWRFQSHQIFRGQFTGNRWILGIQGWPEAAATVIIFHKKDGNKNKISVFDCGKRRNSKINLILTVRNEGQNNPHSASPLTRSHIPIFARYETDVFVGRMKFRCITNMCQMSSILSV